MIERSLGGGGSLHFAGIDALELREEPRISYKRGVRGLVMLVLWSREIQRCCSSRFDWTVVDPMLDVLFRFQAGTL